MVFDPTGTLVGERQDRHRGLRLGRARLRRAGPRPVLAGAGRGLRGALAGPGGPARCARRASRSRRSVGRSSSPTAMVRRCDRRWSGSTSAEPRACRGSAASAASRSRPWASARPWRPSGPRPRPTGSATHEPEPRGRADRALPVAVGLPHPPADRPLRRLGRCPGGLPAVRLQAPTLGEARAIGGGAIAPFDPAWLPELVPPAAAAGRGHGGRGPSRPASRRACRSSRRRATRRARCSARACSTPGVGAISLGTTASINTTQRRYVEVIPLVPPYPAAVPGAYSLEVNVYRGYWMVEWFKREFGAEEVARAEMRRRARGAVRRAPGRHAAGAMGLMLQPYWSPGVRIPGPEAKGAVIGWGDVHTRAHLYRAILEGLAYALREGAEAWRHGRGSRSASCACPVAAPRARRRPAHRRHLRAPHGRPHTHETSGLGAAIDAAVGLGLHPDRSSRRSTR